MKARKVSVLVHRGMSETIAKICYEHEIKCLEVLFGKGNVTITDFFDMVDAPGKKFQILDNKPVSFEIEEVDEEEAYSEMLMAYGSHPTIQISIVEHVYGEDDTGGLVKWAKERYEASEAPKPVKIPVDSNLKSSGLKMGMKVDAEVVREGETMLEDVVVDDPGSPNVLEDMTKRELGELLTNFGIDYGGSQTKQELIAMYEQYDEAKQTAVK